MSRSGSSSPLTRTIQLSLSLTRYRRRAAQTLSRQLTSKLSPNQSSITAATPQNVWNEAHRSGAERPHIESGHHWVGPLAASTPERNMH
jgi:hypothetical protein